MNGWPPLAGERLRLLENGAILLALERRWTDGATHLRFSLVELLERLAVLIPRPRVNLVLYDGVLGARAASRSRIVGCKPPERTRPTTDAGGSREAATAAAAPSGGRCWADLMRRTYGLDVPASPRCGPSAS